MTTLKIPRIPQPFSIEEFARKYAALVEERIREAPSGAVREFRTQAILRDGREVTLVVGINVQPRTQTMEEGKEN